MLKVERSKVEISVLAHTFVSYRVKITKVLKTDDMGVTWVTETPLAQKLKVSRMSRVRITLSLLSPFLKNA